MFTGTIEPSSIQVTHAGTSNSFAVSVLGADENNRTTAETLANGRPPSPLAACADEPLALEMQEDLLGGFSWRQVTGVQDHIRIFWRFVRIRNPGELFDKASPSLRIQPFAVSLFANLQSRGEMHEYESAVRLDQCPHLFAHLIKRCDGRADGDSPVLGDLRGNKPDPSYVDVAVLP